MSSRHSLVYYQFGSILVILYDGIVYDVPPQVGEHEGAGHQQVEDGNLHLSYCEGETENIEAGNKYLVLRITDIVCHHWGCGWGSGLKYQQLIDKFSQEGWMSNIIYQYN